MHHYLPNTSKISSLDRDVFDAWVIENSHSVEIGQILKILLKKTNTGDLQDINYDAQFLLMKKKSLINEKF